MKRNRLVDVGRVTEKEEKEHRFAEIFRLQRLPLKMTEGATRSFSILALSLLLEGRGNRKSDRGGIRSNRFALRGYSGQAPLPFGKAQGRLSASLGTTGERKAIASRRSLGFARDDGGGGMTEGRDDGGTRPLTIGAANGVPACPQSHHLTLREDSGPVFSRESRTLTRAVGAASPATERARRIRSGAERDILIWARGQRGFLGVGNFGL